LVVVAPSTLQQLFSQKRIVTRGARKGKPKLYPDKEALEAASSYFDAIGVDEIHGAMNYDSLRHQITAALAYHPQWRLGLTGTPFGRDPFALWGQAFIIDGGRTLSNNYFFFEPAFGKRKYSHFSRTGYEYVFDKDKMPVLQAKMDHMVLTCKLEEIQDVQVIPSVINLHMSSHQRAAYQELIAELVAAQIEADDEGRSARKKTENIFVRLRQVSSGFRPFTDDEGDARIVEFPNSIKHEWVADFLSDLDPDVKVLIFHEFVPTGRRLEAIAQKAKIKYRWLWGGTKDKREARHEFQHGKAQLLISNHGSGGVGIDLSAADYMCIFESPVGVIAREQMEARPMARSRPLLRDDLVCSTVESKILTFHEQGRNLLDLFNRPRDLARELA
jgi:hypothetical protein